MGAVVLDTSVVSAAIDPADAHHEAAVSTISARRAAGDPIRLSAISVAELRAVKGPRHKERTAWVTRFLDLLGVDAVISVDRETAEIAGDLRATRPSVRLPDALIKASADRIGAELLTADRKLARLDGATLLRPSP